MAKHLRTRKAVSPESLYPIKRPTLETERTFPPFPTDKSWQTKKHYEHIEPANFAVFQHLAY
jgi:hypothetical protein